MLEYLPSDSKNIKESLCHMTKYIENKKIEQNKANNIPDLKGIDEAAWKIISAFYCSGWDLLIADKDN